MNPALPSPPPPIPLSVDRVRMIRRSMRCFVFGMIGAVPVFGLGAAIFALRLRRQLAAETGEPAGPNGMIGCAIVFLFLAAILLYCGQDGIVLALGLLLCALQGSLLFRHYCRTEMAGLNPARPLVFWGAGLAYAGLNLSFVTILLGIAALAAETRP